MAVFQIERENIKHCQQCGNETNKFFIWAQNEKDAQVKANKIILNQGKLLCWECFKKWLWTKQEKYQKRKILSTCGQLDFK